MHRCGLGMTESSLIRWSRHRGFMSKSSTGHEKRHRILEYPPICRKTIEEKDYRK